MMTADGQNAAEMSGILDRRARKSRTAMVGALIDLMRDHDWNDISIRMICDRADIARSTFYSHFQTKQDLLDVAFSVTESELDERSDEGGLDATLLWLAEHLDQARLFQKRLEGTPAGHAIMARFRSQISRRIAADLEAEGVRASPEQLTFAVGGAFQVYETWIASGAGTQPHAIADLTATLIRRVFTP